MKPRFREGEIVRLRVAAGGGPDEGVVDDLAGPDEDGERWLVSLWVDDPDRGGRSLRVVAEDELEATGLAESRDGTRVPVGAVPPASERRSMVTLRVVTPLTDSGVAAQVAGQIEHSIRALVGPCRLTVEAERHWSAPYHYELDVYVEPRGNPVDALRALAEAGTGGWLSCTDDGWRCDLWWSRPDEYSVFLAPEVSGAEVSFVPWDDPSRRPESERPIVAVQVAESYDDGD